MANLADVVFKFLIDTSAMKKGSQQAEKILSDAATQGKKYGDAIQNAADKGKTLGENLTKYVSVPIAGLATAMGISAASYQDSQVKIQNSLGLTAKEAANLTETSRNIYKRGFGESAAEIDNALLQTKQNIKGLNEQDLERITTNAYLLADTFDADVNEVTRAGSNVMEGFGIEADKAFDLMAYGAQNGLNFSNEMFDNLSEYAPLFGEMGFSADEYFQLLVQGSEAGVYNLDYINDVMKENQIRLKDGSKTTADAMGQLSESTQAVWQSYLDGDATVKDVSNSVLSELQGMDDQAKANQIGVDLYGTKFEDLGTEAMYSLGGIDGELKNVDGTMADMTENAEQNFSQRLSATWRKAKDALLPLGIALLDLADKYLPKVEGAIEKVSGWIDKLDGPAKNMILIIGAIASVVGPVIGVLATFAGWIGTLVTSISGAIGWFSALGGAGTGLGASLSALAGPIGWAIAIIGSLIAVGVLLYKNWETVKSKAQEIWEKMTPFINTLKGAFEQMWASVGPIGEQLKELFNTLKPVLVAIGAVVGGVLVTAWGLFMSTMAGVVAAIGPIIQAIISAFQVVANLVMAVIAIFTGDFSAAMDYWNKAADAAVAIFVNLWEGLKAFFVTFIDAVVGFFGGLGSYFSEFWTGVKTTFMDSVNGIINWVKDAWAVGIALFQVQWNQLKSFFSAFWEGTKAVFMTVINAIVSAASAVWQSAIDTWKAFYNGLKNFFVGLWNGVKSIFVSVISAIVSWATNIWNLTISGWKTIFNTLANFFKVTWSAIKNTFVTLINTIVSWVTNTWNKSIQGWKNLFTILSNFFKVTWSNIKNTFWTVVNAVVSFVVERFNNLRNNINNIFNRIKEIVRSVWSWIQTNIADRARNIYNNVRDAFTNMYNKIRDKLTDAKNKVKEIFTDMVDEAKGLPKRIGDGIKNAASKVQDGVLAVANTMMKGLGKGVNGVIKGVNWVLDKVGSDKKYDEWEVPQYKRGTSGHPGGPAIVGDGGKPELIEDNGRYMMSPARSTMMMLGKGARVLSGNRTEQLMKSLGVPAYKDGEGIWGSAKNVASDLWGGAKKTAGKVWNKTKDIALDIWDYATDPKKLFNKVLDQLGISVPSMSGGFGDALKGGYNKVKDTAIDYVKDIFGGGEGGFGGDGGASGDVKSWISAAIQKTGVPMSWLGALSTIAMRESGGRTGPSTVNRWDSNWLRGTPSMGLMQTIRPTFDSFKEAGWGNIMNPSHNAAAAINYIKSRYGTVFNVPGIKNLAKGLPYVGYAVGGIIKKAQTAMLGEGNKEEVVIPLEQYRDRALGLLQYAASKLGVLDPSMLQDTGSLSSSLSLGMSANVSGNGGGLADKIAKAIAEVLGDMEFKQYTNSSTIIASQPMNAVEAARAADKASKQQARKWGFDA
jgi:phage-related minor tail protein/SLT domain-containing protein